MGLHCWNVRFFFERINRPLDSTGIAAMPEGTAGDVTGLDFSEVFCTVFHEIIHSELIQTGLNLPAFMDLES